MSELDARLAEKTAVEVPDGDYYTYLRTDGSKVQVLVAATEEEKDRAHGEALKRTLDAIEFRLVHLDDPPLPWQEAPTKERVEHTRRSLQNERQYVLDELERVGAPVTGEKRGRGK